MDKGGTSVIRYRDGAVDDVAIDCTHFRMEQMDDGLWWIGVYRGKERVCFFLGVSGWGIVAEVSEDELGCSDDSTKGEGEQEWDDTQHCPQVASGRGSIG